MRVITWIAPTGILCAVIVTCHLPDLDKRLIMHLTEVQTSIVVCSSSLSRDNARVSCSRFRHFLRHRRAHRQNWHYVNLISEVEHCSCGLVQYLHPPQVLQVLSMTITVLLCGKTRQCVSVSMVFSLSSTGFMLYSLNSSINQASLPWGSLKCNISHIKLLWSGQIVSSLPKSYWQNWHVRHAVVNNSFLVVWYLCCSAVRP